VSVLLVCKIWSRLKLDTNNNGTEFCDFQY
jgi:hypothetical protein